MHVCAFIVGHRAFIRSIQISISIYSNGTRKYFRIIICNRKYHF